MSEIHSISGKRVEDINKIGYDEYVILNLKYIQRNDQCHQHKDM